MSGEEQRERAARVRLILLDVDGVLTDGRLYWGAEGEQLKAFDVKDGHGIRVGQLVGLRFGIISGRNSPAVAHRAASLDIDEVHLGVHDKIERLGGILERAGVAEEAVCFVGDDLIDLQVMRRVGFAVAPADAVPEVLEAAHWVTRRPGGRGAVREVVDFVLRASGRWDEATSRFFGHGPA